MVAATRYVSLGSVISSSLAFAAALLFDYFVDCDPAFIVNTVLMAFSGGLIVFRHRANIKRLITHSEKKLGEKAK